MNHLAANAPAGSLSSFIEGGDSGRDRLHLMVENVHCAGCIRKIETALLARPGVESARVNVSTRRLVIEWRHGEDDPVTLAQTVDNLGYPTAPFNPATLMGGGASEDKRLLTALAVAGFAAANVMLLSVSIWSGYFSDMGPATRELFHWVSALIALPAVVYAGQPFFRSAWTSLRGGALNMDVPISVAVILASAMSLQQTMVGGEHAYFDASVTLLFFLLVGRYLDRRARARARSAAERLLTLQTATATVVGVHGALQIMTIADIAPGMIVAVAAGERLPVDGRVIEGRSEADTSLVSGESMARPITVGDAVFAGTINLAQPLRVEVTAAGENTLLAEIVRLMEAAEQGRARYVRIADRVARIYAPAVHILALGTFVGWMVVGTGGWQPALMAAITVLIITCPCALGLAVPVVQVVASGRLLNRGVLLKSNDGLERLEAIDTVVFDKTGTLTLGRPTLTNGDSIPNGTLAMAATLAGHSNHPLSRAIVTAAKPTTPLFGEDVAETPGRGLSGRINGRALRLGSRDWCGVTDSTGADGPEIWLSGDGMAPQRFSFADVARPDAATVIAALRKRGLHIELLSGDRPHVVTAMADQLGISKYHAECLPDHKVQRLKQLAEDGHKVLMVGDGLNDAPALAAGFVSMSPAGAADISQTAADLIFQGDSLAPVLHAVETAGTAGRLVRQNFALAFLYNAIAIPVAVAGLATPLVAAVAMSSSSLVVTLNALRLRLAR
jgi:P-type Cu2+ transporter